jgi:predicted metal-dependent phosphoesterase TrpH
VSFRIDLHSHSTVSDGLLSPEDLVETMSRAGISALALTDHDALDGLPSARAAAQRLDMELIPGAEISADAPDGGDVHILALFVDESNEPFRSQLERRQENRRSRGETMARNLIAAGFTIDLDAIRRDVGDGVWGRPHLARALVAAGYARDSNDAFSRFLHRECPWYVAQQKWSAADVVDTIRGAGGISSLAHPVWYENPELLVERLSQRGLDAIEVFHPDHDAREVARFSALAARFHMLSTAGSDYHGIDEKGKTPGRVTGDRAMLDALRERLAIRR